MDDTEALLEHARARADQLARAVDEARALDDEQLQHATRSIETAKQRIATLEEELATLSDDLTRASTPFARALPVVLLGLSAPLACVSAFLFFFAGLWPLGLLALLLSVAAGFTIVFEARRER